MSSPHDETELEPEGLIQKRLEELAERLKKLRTDPERTSAEASSLESTLSSIRAEMARQRKLWKDSSSED